MMVDGGGGWRSEVMKGCDQGSRVLWGEYDTRYRLITITITIIVIVINLGPGWLVNLNLDSTETRNDEISY